MVSPPIITIQRIAASKQKLPIVDSMLCGVVCITLTFACFCSCLQNKRPLQTVTGVRKQKSRSSANAKTAFSCVMPVVLFYGLFFPVAHIPTALIAKIISPIMIYCPISLPSMR